MKRSSILLLIALALTTTSCNYFKEHRLFSRDVDSVLDMTLEEPATPVIDTAIAYEEPVLEPEITEPVYEPQPAYGYGSGRYFMIVGSFQNRSFAERYAEKIQNMGYQTQIIEASNGYYRVSAKSYTNFQTGVNEIDEFRASVAPRAWLHVKN